MACGAAAQLTSCSSCIVVGTVGLGRGRLPHIETQQCARVRALAVNVGVGVLTHWRQHAGSTHKIEDIHNPMCVFL